MPSTSGGARVADVGRGALRGLARGDDSRGGLVWLVLFAAYAATVAIDATSWAAHAGDELRQLRVAASITGAEALVRDPVGVGFALTIAPAHALGGGVAVELWLAAVTALGFALGSGLARRIVPDPWATRGVLAVGLSPPALAHATEIAPAMTAGTLLVAATSCAVRVRDRPRPTTALGGALALALLPWLAPRYAIPALPVAILLVRWTARRGRGWAALGAAEVMLGSLVFYVSLNEQLYGGPTPLRSLRAATGATFPGGYLERWPRLAAVWIDRDAGLLRWAPVLALAGFAIWLLRRSRRARLARLAPERREAEHAAFICLLACAGVIATAVLATPSLPGLGGALAAGLSCAAPLVAWGLRHAPRTGAALALLTLAASAWLLAALWTGATWTEVSGGGTWALSPAPPR